MLKLFLPVIFPSWRFFSSIGPSPRIHYGFLESETGEPSEWYEFRPKPEQVSLKEGFCRLFHNPKWNETLYINTCAERLFEGYSEMREREIMRRLLHAVELREIKADTNAQFLVYKITAIIREGETIQQLTTFTARPSPLNTNLKRAANER